MKVLESTLKTLAHDLGADRVGIASRDRLAAGPPSADPCYCLPSARSAIAFAVALDEEAAQAFITKAHWRPHCHDRKAVVRRLYEIGDALVRHLRARGHAAVNVEINNNYRPEAGAADVTEMTAFHPEFAHRYAGVAAGIGRLGWSGNLLSPGFGARIELGSVLTSAVLRADAPMADADHPCDGCRMCTKVCPVEMIRPGASTRVTVAGVTETISRKRRNTCCWIGCSGYEGLSADGTWSNWSPYRLGRPLPAEGPALDRLCIALQKADPQMQTSTSSFADYRGAVFDPHWFYYTVCGFCRLVCAPQRAQRLSNRKRIVGSGTVALKLDGSHVVADENAVSLPTPFGLNVVVPREELSQRGAKPPHRPGQFPLDHEVIDHLYRR